MSGLLEVVSRLEKNGGSLRLEGDRIRYSVPSGNREALNLLAELRQHRDAVRTLLIERAARQDSNSSSQDSRAVRAMPPGVRLINWDLKEPPVGIDSCSVIIDPALFARSTLEQLGVAQVGVIVALESEDG